MHVSKHSIKAADGSVVFRSADEVNAEFPSGWELPYDDSVLVTEFMTSETEQFVRFFTDGVTEANGRWLVKRSDIEGIINDPAAIKEFLSLPNVPDKIIDVNIPSGIRLRTGKAGQNAYGNGGGTQFEIPFPDLTNTEWYNNIQDL